MSETTKKFGELEQGDILISGDGVQRLVVIDPPEVKGDQAAVPVVVQERADDGGYITIGTGSAVGDYDQEATVSGKDVKLAQDAHALETLDVIEKTAVQLTLALGRPGLKLESTTVLHGVGGSYELTVVIDPDQPYEGDDVPDELANLKGTTRVSLTIIPDDGEKTTRDITLLVLERLIDGLALSAAFGSAFAQLQDEPQAGQDVEPADGILDLSTVPTVLN